MKIYQHPRSLPRSADYCLQVNGREVDVLATGVADFALVALEPADFPAHAEVRVRRTAAPEEITVRPLARGIAAEMRGHEVRFTLARPERLSLDFGWGVKPLYLFAEAPENAPPAPGAPGAVTFPAGQVTELPLLTLEDGQTLYIPGGAVLKTRIHVRGKRGVRLCGHGILDGSFHDVARDGGLPLCVLERCPGVVVEDLTFVRPQAWMLLLGACEGATVRRLKEIGEVMSSDGIDVVGSRDVLVEDCFLHNNDDCVAVKAFEIGANNLAGLRADCRENVENVLVRRCVFANWTGGNAMEIGHELAVDHVRGVIFRDIDVLHVHGTGAVFSIHNYDSAAVSDVLFEDIRVEHCYDKFIDIRVSRSRFSTDPGRGVVRDVTFRNIVWHRSIYSPGYTVSLIGGANAARPVANVTIENVVINGRPSASLDELEIHARHCSGLRYVAPDRVESAGSQHATVR